MNDTDQAPMSPPQEPVRAAEPPAESLAESLADAPDDPRTRAARARGLKAPYLPGGRDPEIEATLRDERRYMRLLVAMVALIVGTGTILAIVGALMTAVSPST